jgi:hypothetical protein
MESRYYEASMPGSYGGVRTLARYSGSPVSAVGRWLEKKDPYTLHKPTAKRFLRRKTFAKTINDVFSSGSGRYEKPGTVQRRLLVHTYVHRRLFPLRVCGAGQRQTWAHVSSVISIIEIEINQ